ncbi:putative LRR receptor-like serine/threonine-protein kinase [Abeliophyllum distichum]|uniref:non-specific serine/threonine protein kinase n=1 Tax=Abeliophyllum distichum TaxID=126358 RepID=A0ABD1VSY2_9LAMI
MILSTIHPLLIYVTFALTISILVFDHCDARALHYDNETDRLALLSFKSSIIHDPFGVLSSWNDSIGHFCKWRGVTCSRSHQRVTRLNLESQSLTGSISPSIGNLSFLKELYLDNNSFISGIPQQLGHLGRLEYLWLNNNSLGGMIPVNISACSNLVELDVSFNNLRGEIPVQLNSLSKLQLLYVDDNNLTGEIPVSFGNLSSLVEFFANFNRLNGMIPDSFGQLRILEAISLSDNDIYGTIPSTIFNLSAITGFEVSGNRLHGNLPSDMGISLSNLTFFSIADNQFTGSLPSSLSNMSYLEYLMVDGNNLSGKFPNLPKSHRLSWLSATGNQLGSGEADDLSFILSLTNATELKSLAINNNNFGGVLPESLGNLSSKLVLLYLDNNQISGRIPDEIGNLFNLQDIQLWNNKLIGNIPPIIGKLRNMTALDLSVNRLTGEIPSSIGNLSTLIYLSLRENKLHGSIPSILENCQKLLELDLSKNNLSGMIPQQIFLPSLSVVLNISWNHLVGPLPVQVGNLRNIGQVDVSNNMLTGEIPNTIGSCERLEVLNMEGNFFRGVIPKSLNSLRGIQFLDLSNNNLSGEIPDYFGGFKLQYLNLSHNDFSGKLTEAGIFKNASAIGVSGNPKLCGGIPELRLPKCKSKRSRRTSPSIIKLIIGIISGFWGLCIVSVSLFLCWLKKAKREPPSRSLEISPLNVSYQSLLRATNGFSVDNIIGAGSFGTVYRGILADNRTLVAVKVLNLSNRRASKSFIAECNTWRSIRHRNLVKVLSACSGVDYKGNDFKALVYEFMAAGSLQEWLHPSEPESRTLNLLKRLNIAIDVANALDYLHNQCKSPVVHCDLKPGNILLDNEFVSHVGDFGLSRFLSKATQNFSTTERSSELIKGSIGYVAPEYGMGGEVSTFGDVYSFGILLLEMFTGKRPTDDMFNEGIDLHKYVKNALPDRLDEIVDPSLIQEFQEEPTSTETIDIQNFKGTQNFQKCLISVFTIGIICSAESATERINIADVLAKLHSTKSILF